MDTFVKQFEAAVMSPLSTFGREVAAAAPNILAAILILVAGYFVSKFGAFIVGRLSNRLHLDRYLAGGGIEKMLALEGGKLSMASVLGKLTYYMLMVMFVMSAADVLSLEVMASAMKSIVLYLPNVVATVFVLLFGFFIAGAIRKVVAQSAHSMNIEFAEALAKTAYAIIALISISLAIGQLGIETTLLNYIASILFVAFGAALALSLGLGTRTLSADLIAGSYIREMYHPGDRIAVSGIEGELIRVGTTKTIIKTEEEKEVSVSNSDMISQHVHKSWTAEVTAFSDAELVAKAKRELPYVTEAYEALMMRHQNRIYTVCRRVLRDRQLAEDATQESMLVIFHHLRDLKEDALFGWWSYKIAYRESLAIAKKRNGMFFFESLPELLQTTDESLEWLLEAEELMASVSEEERRLLEQKYIYEYKDEEIAAQMNLTVGAVKMRLKRLKTRLGER